MIQAKCIEKFRDKTGKIYGYRLIDLNGNINDVKSNNLKEAIRNKDIHVVNLTLTSDNRLIDTIEKQIKSKELGKTPINSVNKLDETYKDVAKALAYLYKETTDNCSAYEYWVRAMHHRAFNEKLDITKNTSLDELLYKAFLKMANDKPNEISYLIGCWEECEHYPTFEHIIQYENVDSINKSKIYKALFIVYKYAKEHKFSKKVITPLKNFLDKVKTTGIAAINIGYNAGHNYYRYLDEKLFGTISNTVFTVGHTITSSDIKEHKEYKGYNYVFHKDINKCGAPQISIAAFFKNYDADNVQVDIKIERHGYTSNSLSCVGIRGYILDVESFLINKRTSVEEYSRDIANRFNQIAPKLYDLADIHQSLYSSLAYEKAPEVLSLKDLESHGKIKGLDLVNLAISRWTKIRGDKTSAKIDMMNYSSDVSFRLIYSNNVSDNGNDRRLYVKYNGKEITLKVLDGNDTNKVIIEETSEMTGSIVDNSCKFAEVMCKAMISANIKNI